MHKETDFLIIGSGIAGLSFALKVAEHGDVALITKKEAMESNTNKAQGGIASVFGESDSFNLHIQDTLAAGDGICKRDIVEMVVREGPTRINELIMQGVDFNLSGAEPDSRISSNLELGREGGHSQNRIVHAADMTGKAVEAVLLRLIRNHQRITLYENHIAIDLITTPDEDACCGAYVLDRKTRQIKTFSSKITLLATGGAGKVYLYTSNPDIATGDGIAMGYRAGITVANLEFVQFHPTCLFHPEAKNFLISEAVRGEGAILVNSAGEPFMRKYDPQADLACRDVVARAIDNELKERGDKFVFLEISHRDPGIIKTRFPNLYRKCLDFGIDMTREPIPVVPAAHYMCGGVVTDACGRTDIGRLYAIGETACTGLHGANRLASNSLLEALVYAETAATQAIKDLKTKQTSNDPQPPLWDFVGTTDSDERIVVSHIWDEIRRMMWNYVGIVRSDKRLTRAERRIKNIQAEIKEYYWDFKVTADLLELRNIATVAELIIQSALDRKESRGLHYNIGYPQKNEEHWRKDTILKRSGP